MSLVIFYLSSFYFFWILPDDQGKTFGPNILSARDRNSCLKQAHPIHSLVQRGLWECSVGRANVAENVPSATIKSDDQCLKNAVI